MLFIQEADISLQINVTIDETCSNSPERLLEINVTIDTRCFYNLNFTYKRSAMTYVYFLTWKRDMRPMSPVERINIYTQNIPLQGSLKTAWK